MDKYINLKNECVIDYGFNGAVIYDFNNVKQYDVHPTESKILYDVEKGTSLQKLTQKYDSNILKMFLDQLLTSEIAYISERFIPHETYRVGPLILSSTQRSYELNKVYLELPFDCNKNCYYCTLPKVNGCFSCSIPKKITDKNLDFYKSTIAKLDEYSAQTIILHGGNPFMHWDFCKTIIDYIKNKTNISIFLIAPSCEINSDILDYLYVNKITLFLNIEYTDTLNINNFLNDFKYTKNINILFNFNVHFNDLNSFKKLYNDLINKQINSTYSVYSNNYFKLNYSEDLPTNLLDIQEFSLLDYFHPCLYGTLSIKSDMKVYPCIGFTKNELIDLSANTFEDLLFKDRKLFDFWELPVKSLDNCSTCKYKKTCSDCRAFELNYNQEINSKKYCTNCKEKCF